MARATYGGGSVKQVGPGRFQIRWSEGIDPFTGKHVRRSETIIAKNLTDARRELRYRTSRRRKVSRMTLGDLIEAALPQVADSDRTREAYRFALNHVPDAALRWEASEITVIQAKHLIDGLAERHGPWMVRKTHTALMSCWKFARNSGWLGDDNPWRRLPLPRVEASAGEPLTDDEVDRLREACADELERLWIELHLATGARPGEIVGIRWSDIDLEGNVLTLTDAKHKGARRAVALPPGALIERIRSWQAKQTERALKAGTGRAPDPYLISNTPDSATPWRVAYAGSYRWPRLRDRAEIRDLRLYDLRHTHNSWLAADGIDDVTRAERIGNSPATNARTYSHSLRDREAAEVVGRRLG